MTENVLAHGTGALNLQCCRIDGLVTSNPLARNAPGFNSQGLVQGEIADGSAESIGRWPANVIHDGSEAVLAEFPYTASGDRTGNRNTPKTKNAYGAYASYQEAPALGDEGSAARFFYCAKASKEDRDDGLETFTPRQYSHDGRETPIENAYQRNNSVARNHHPTVKPTDLMRYLCRMITPPGAIVLDPFMGSGSTGKGALKEGFRFIGIEQDEEYFEIACARIRDAQKQPNMFHELQYKSSGDCP